MLAPHCLPPKDGLHADKERQRAQLRLQQLQADVGRLRGQESELKRKLQERVVVGERAAAERARELAALRRAGAWAWGVSGVHGGVGTLLERLGHTAGSFSFRHVAVQLCSGTEGSSNHVACTCCPQKNPFYASSRTPGDAASRRVGELEKENAKQRQALQAMRDEAAAAHKQLKDLKRSQVRPFACILLPCCI